MALAIAPGIPLRAPTVQHSKAGDRRLSAKGVHGAVNCLVQKSDLGNPFLTITIRRRAWNCSSRKAAGGKVNKFKVTAGVESSADSEARESGKSSEKYSALHFLHRRELLLAATGSFTYLSSPGIGQAAPVPPSDLHFNKCSPVDLATPGQTEHCCLPDATNIQPIQFKFEDLPMRTRRPAHILSQDRDYISKYNEAYKQMKALPDNDPRSFKNQWQIHCAFCEGAYLEPGNTNGLPLQYHFSWAFLPWHRMYLYFHERILGELIGDRNFALPFWNWDNQRPGGGNQLPRMFTDELGDLNFELRNAIRNTEHFPPQLVNLSGINGSVEDIKNANLSIVHRAVVSSTSADLFMGGAYRANQSEGPNSPGTCEADGHNVIHQWTGAQNNPQYPDNQDMGTFTYAARDPIFYSHHSNVDRMWSVWKTLPVDEATRRGRRQRQESGSADFMDAQFAFYDQQQQLVHVRISDTIDTGKLRYEYEAMDSDSDWINFTPRPSGARKPSPGDIEPFARTIPLLAKDEPRTFALGRREPTDEETKGRDDEELIPEDLEETLLIKGVKVPKSNYFAYRVFINLPDADTSTPLDINEFVGVISHIPHGHSGAGARHDHSSSVRGLDFRLSIGAAMKSLQLPVGEPISVTFIPQNQNEDVPFDGLESEWR